ncbi:MAG: hypothetical protein SFH39_02280 [Candidatus Magnetobacterium sp. LHC-1]|uniref:Uncharacterized protein n=1 Tax=Candidatus Magnetobacterium casense TaxID=1455061 RepID=A0ABS6RZR1_9BACT|nr:hypothetical protein [Candidatus Magnetobacterium casensis]MBF0607762.1 hypothetical protein [Nitrospirota bacterium]MBV6342107.1 hypothetical protein [Candidatus Magnetobacterium casensis]
MQGHGNISDGRATMQQRCNAGMDVSGGGQADNKDIVGCSKHPHRHVHGNRYGRRYGKGRYFVADATEEQSLRRCLERMDDKRARIAGRLAEITKVDMKG